MSQGIDITDPNEGLDLIVRVEKGYNGWLIPESIDTALKTSKLTDGDVDELIDTVTNINDIYSFRDPEEMKEAISNFANDSSEENNSQGSVKNFSNSNNKNDGDIDFDNKTSASDVSDKFDKMLS